MTLSKMAKTLGLGAAVVALSAGAAFAATATSAVNVRTGPGTQYRAIDTLNAGQRVDVTGQNAGWCEINQNGPDGWVSCRYLTADTSYRSYDRYDDGHYDDGPNVTFQFGFGNAYPNRPHRPYHPGWPNTGHYPYGNGFGFSFGN
ncbi:MAG: SH3 domain-containing protein [Devosia sp.]